MSEEEGKKGITEEITNEKSELTNEEDKQEHVTEKTEEDEETEEILEEDVKELNEEGKRMVELKKVGERKQEKKHEVTSQELTAGKKVIEALEKRKQAQSHEEELLKKIKDEDVVPHEGETIEQAKERIVQEMIEKERKGSIFEDTDRAKDKKLISNMFDVDVAPYDTLFDIQWGMRSNTAAVREPRGYIIDGVFPFLIDKEEEESQYGIFCHENVYIYLAPGKSAETFNIFCWYGNNSSVGKKGVCAMLASQLSVCLDNHAKIYYEVDGNESELFKEMFEEGITYTDENATDELLHPPKKEKRKLRLFKIDEVYKNLTRVEQVEPNHVSLTPYDGFVFDDNKRVYVFTTKYASNRVKNRALQFAMVLKAQNNYEESEVFMEPSPKMLLFYRALKLDDMNYNELCEYIMKEYKPIETKPSFGMLMRFTHNTKTSQIVKTIKPDNIPLTKKMLRSHRCYVYDCGNEIFMWKGKKCSRKEWELLKMLANKVIMKMVDRPKWCKIQDEFEGKETEAFKYHVADWDYTTTIITDDDYEKHISLLSKRIDYNALVIKEINEAKKEFEKANEEEKKKEGAGQKNEDNKEENNASKRFKENIQKKIQLLVGKKEPIIYDYKWDIDGYKLKIQSMMEKKWEPTVLTKDTIDYELKYNITETLKLTDIQIYAFVDIVGPSIFRIPAEKYGEFYEENSYIVSVEKWDFERDIWRRDFYFWEGKKSTPLYYSQFLKKNYPVLVEYYEKNKNRKENEMNARQASENRIIFNQQRVFQGCEPKTFAELFNLRIVVKKGNYKDTVVIQEDNTNYDEDENEEDYEYGDEEDEEVEYYDEDGNLIEPGDDEEWEYEEDEIEEEPQETEENNKGNEPKEDNESNETENGEKEQEVDNEKEEEKKVIVNRFFEISMEDRTQRIEELNLEDENVGKYIESHRCYALQTLYSVYLWIGKQTDQISRIQAIRSAITLLEEDREFVCFEEGFHYNEFWDILHGVEKGYLSLSPKDLGLAAPLTFEITPFSQNFIRIGMNWKQADPSSCYIFDCMTRIYVWMGDESIPLQQKYAIKVGYDYAEERMKERKINIEIITEYCGKESDHFIRMSGGERMEYYDLQNDPREVYYNLKKESWVELPEEEKITEENQELKIDWSKVNEDEFNNKMKESRNQGIKELQEKEKLKEKGNKLLLDEWKSNKELNDFIKTFKDEDTDIESLPDEDKECKEVTTKQLMEEIKKEEDKEKQERDEIDKMIEEELKEKYGDNIEYVEEDDGNDEEWEDGDWEYEYEDAGEYEEDGDDEYEKEDDEYEYEEEEENEESEEYESGEEDEDQLESKKNATESKEKTIEDLRKEEKKKEDLEKKQRNKAVDKKNTYLNEVVACDYCYEEHPRYLLRKNIVADDMENGICWECWKIYFPDEKWPDLEHDK
ncbi:hypothetical protein ENUP19_0080G0028 [Entamoeba nuttalli]|uniref:Gelsolin repeat protein, putative n=2 Tax=Entamoeba nuttalli TaxID=412467 RepID=K2HI86_ENTNP|nr:gelsolin repeat protein, putative [Entamoeba nuttalli P19]EKE42689.1 gelsolin repeat protein, putative [Entamoeba nuttalli P19]|eukprot:XP_008854978.1 gelsolin repeat protein, putative [Entamoeba nuttalli P19]